MKVLNLLLFVLIAVPSVHALDYNAEVDAGVGLFSSYGILGLGGRYYLNDNIDLHATLGVDVTGTVFGLGSRYYAYRGEETTLLGIHYEPAFYVGATALRNFPHRFNTEKDGVKSEYKSSNGFGANYFVGYMLVFSKIMTFGFELGYRQWFTRPDLNFNSGTYSQTLDDDIQRLRKDSVSGAFNIGFVF